MDISAIIPHIEALIFASDKALSIADLEELVNNALGFIDDRANAEQMETAISAIKEKYSSEFYPFEVVESGGGYQFLTKKEYHKTVAQLNGDKFLKKLSAAALETLAIIAYKQPITKGEIEGIRGVNCDYAVQKLLEKDLVIIIGRKENAPGQPLLYSTSKSFMDYFGINSPQDLPKLSDIIPQDIVIPTEVTTSNPVDTDITAENNDDEAKLMVVTENGEIAEIPVDETLQDVSDIAADEANEIAENNEAEIVDELPENATIEEPIETDNNDDLAITGEDLPIENTEVISKTDSDDLEITGEGDDDTKDDDIESVA
jgi:segregation and condensation protein B